MRMRMPIIVPLVTTKIIVRMRGVMVLVMDMIDGRSLSNNDSLIGMIVMMKRRRQLLVWVTFIMRMIVAEPVFVIFIS